MPARRFAVSEDLTIHHIHELAPELIAAACSGDLTLDLSAIERIDSSGIQLLAVLKREAGRCQTRLVFDKPSAAVIDIVEFYRLPEILAGASDA